MPARSCSATRTASSPAGLRADGGFDDSRAQSFDATAASTDGTDYSLSISDGPRLAAEVKRASTATFNVTIRGAGAQTVTFNVAGLRWRG